MSTESSSNWAAKQDWAGRRVLLSCGPMRTQVDPVRFLQNRSSGKMGLAIAQALAAKKAEVTCLLGPVDSSIRNAFLDLGEVRDFLNAEDYGSSLEALFPRAEVFFSAAAVLDFEVQADPLKRSRESLAQAQEWALRLRPVPDFAALMGERKQPSQRLVAFAAEDPSQLLERAQKKRLNKKADVIVANPVTETFGPDGDDNVLWVLAKDFQSQIGPGPKTKLGAELVDLLERLCF